MELLTTLIGMMMHLDQHLHTLTTEYGVWVYAILFLIIFAETGLVVTPFLPGDSLLFATGAIAAIGTLEIVPLFALLVIAAMLGNISNYHIGARVGPKVFNSGKSRLFNKEYITITQRYYTRYGAKTVVIGRFLPIVRTFAPFVAGIGKMDMKQFAKYSTLGAFLWVGLFLVGGYFFGNMEVVKKNFSMVIIAIIIVSILPAVIEFARHHYLKWNNKP
ncbi:MAG: DedA family protein [Nitrospinae bacterium]|nr:DedA family protein [Nitrospinota bacterium]